MVTSTGVLRYLAATDLPAHRDEIVRKADHAGAPVEIPHALRALPPVDHHNTGEVAWSATTRPTAEETPAMLAAPATLAARARDRRHQRVARHLRGI